MPWKFFVLVGQADIGFFYLFIKHIIYCTYLYITVDLLRIVLLGIEMFLKLFDGILD